MIKGILQFLILIAIWIFSLFLIFYMINFARAEDCPPNFARCRVIVLNPQEEQALLQPNGVLDTAEQGRPLDNGPMVRYFRQKIINSGFVETNVTNKSTEPKAEEPAK